MPPDGEYYSESLPLGKIEQSAILSPEDVRRCREINIGSRELIMDVVRAVCRETEIPVAAILGDSRKRTICQARWLICYLARERGHTVEAIGRAIRKDHSSVVYGAHQERIRRGGV